MKWTGMSGVGVQEPLISPLLARGACFLLVAVATWAQPALSDHTYHHRHHTTTLTASNVKVRPERAALTPPTVTSLRPPDRNKNGQHVGGVTIPGEQSGSNNPPIVASLSPSSIGSSDHHLYLNNPRIIHHRQPTASVATAESNSRNDASLTEQHSLSDHHHTYFAPTPKNISSSTWHRIPMLAATSSRVVPEPVEEGDTKEGGEDVGNPAVGGVWETGTFDEGTVWAKGNHRPNFSHGRPDTFGHSITEDLSHLKTEYSPRRDRGREAGQTFTSYSVTEDSSRAISDQYYPRQHHRGFAGHEDNFHNAGSNDFHISSGSIPEQASKRISASRQVASQTSQPHHERTSEPNHGGFETVDYTLQSKNNQERSNPRIHGKPNDDNYPVVRDRGTSRANPNTATTTSSSTRPQSIQEIVRAKNLSNTDDLLLFLKEKGIPFSKLIEFINRGAKIQEVLLFLHQSDTQTPLYEPSLSSEPNNKPLRDLSLSDDEYAGNVLKNKTRPSKKTSEISQIPESPKLNSGTFFSKSVVHDTATSDMSDNQNFPLSTSPEDELNDEALKETLETDDEKKRRRNRKGQKGRQRGKNRGKKNKGQRGKKGEHDGLPDLVYTTVILPVDSNINGSGAIMTKFLVSSEIPLTTTTIPSVSTKPSTTTVESNIPNLSTDLPISAQPSSSTQSPIPTLPAEPTTKTASRPSINLAQIPLSPHSPTNTPSSTTKITAALLPTTVLITSTQQATLPPTTTKLLLDPSGGGRGTPFPETEGSATAKTSEVSILSVTIMEVPADHEDETVLEYPKPTKKRPSHQQDMSRPHERRRPPKVLHNSTKHTSISTMEQTERELKSRTNFVREQQKDDYVFPIKGILIISGVMGALAVFTLVVLISYAVIKCSKKPVVNNYQVSEQKPVAQ